MDKELLHTYFKGETTSDEEKQIIDWAESSPENYNEYLEERKIWNALLLYPAKSTHPIRDHHRSIILTFSKYAAVVAILLLIGTFVFYNIHDSRITDISPLKISEPVLLRNNQYIALNKKSFSLKEKTGIIKNDHKNNELSYHGQNSPQAPLTEETDNRLLVPHGTTYRLMLSDGTSVILNAESELIFPSQFNGKSREVTLKGEAFFQVAHNEKYPFIVHTEPLDVQVLGTSFNICSYTQENMLRTTLIEGSIQINQDGETVQVRPAEQYIYDKQTKEKSIKIVETDIYTAWINNEYIFKNTPLNEIFDKIGHWYKFNTEYEHPSLKEKRFTFSIGKEASFDQIIRFINSTEEVYIERTNENITIKNYPTP